jgi:chromatin remodeling complex protein RSC6
MPKAKKVSKKTASKAKKEVVVQEATKAAPVAPAATTTPTPVPNLQDQFASLLAQLTSLRSQLTTVTTQVRMLSKRADRELKQAQKVGRKKRKTGNRAPSGFVKPTKISSELAAFLNKPKGTEMARTEVTREINNYIREHKLQDPKNGRHIIADNKLKKLLKLTSKDNLTYFNLQRYMSPHFAKAGSSLPAATSTATAVSASASN